MYANLLPFQELLLAACFSAPKQILQISHVAYVCRFWNGEKLNETAKKPDETAKKIRPPAIIIAVSDFER